MDQVVHIVFSFESSQVKTGTTIKYTEVWSMFPDKYRGQESLFKKNVT